MKQNLTFGWKYAVALASLMTLSACGGSGTTSLVGTTGSSTTTTTEGTSLLVTSAASVNAVINSGIVSAAVDFNSSESTPVTDLQVTAGLSSLPAAWSGPGSFSCASVTTGSGCVLNLTYAPTAIEKGTLTISFSYKDSTGKAQTGSTIINYVGTTNNNVVGTASPSGQVAATVGGGAQTVQVNFTTDDGNAATGLSLTTDLGALPAGWSSSAHTFSCASVSTGTGCQLTLSFAPQMLITGTLTLAYTYTDNFGVVKVGAVHVPYIGTVHNHIVGVAAPSSVSSPIGNTAVAVLVTFTTDDGNPATNLVLTSNLSALPPGWASTATSFNCGMVSVGTSCQLPLSFTATARATGTLQLTYSYLDNSGASATGSVNVPYVSTSHNSVLGTSNPDQVIRVKVGATTQIEVVFTTNDGNTATDFQITSDLTSLSNGWSGTNGFTCNEVNTGTGCELPLSFSPTMNSTGTITINYSYTDSASTAQTGSATVAYSNPHLYAFFDASSNDVHYCPLNLDGTLGTCAPTASGTEYPYGAGTFTPQYGYVPDNSTGTVDLCTLDPAGTLSNCAASGGTFANSLYYLTTNGLYVFASISTGAIISCPIGTGGTLSNCTTAATVANAYGLTVSGNQLYITTAGSGATICTIGGNGSLSNCQTTGGAAMANAYRVVISGGFSYAANGGNGVTVCAVSGVDGTLSSCASYPVSESAFTTDIAVLNSDLYLSYQTSDGSFIDHCSTDPSTGAVSNCAVSMGGLASYTYSLVLQ